MKAKEAPPTEKPQGSSDGENSSKKALTKLLMQQNQNNMQVLQRGLRTFTHSKVSMKPFGPVRSFAANTNVGTVRKVNEDRISIILNVIQP